MIIAALDHRHSPTASVDLGCDLERVDAVQVERERASRVRRHLCEQRVAAPLQVGRALETAVEGRLQLLAPRAQPLELLRGLRLR